MKRPLSINSLKKALALTVQTSAGLAVVWALTLTTADLSMAKEKAPRSPKSAYNPKSDPDDLILPMPGGYQMVFRRVPVPGDGYWGGGERVAVLGADNDTPFEPLRTVRVGGNFQNADKSWYLAMGKYEVTVGQYVMLMGNNNPKEGLAILRRKVKSSKFQKKLEADSRSLAKTMASPLRWITYYEFQEFIARYNEWCLANANCLASLRDNLGAGAFFRLPTEIEWEYIARGGADCTAKRPNLPFERVDISDYAVVDMGLRKSRPKRIGSADPVHGLYDLFGNVAEYMAEPYTLDYGFGMVGGRVARGSSYFDKPKNVTVTKRVEIPLFRKKGSTFRPVRSPTVGIRLMIGTTATAGRGVIKKIVGEHKSGYVAVNGDCGRDVAGNSRRSAKKLGDTEDSKLVKMTDTVGGDDTADYFSVYNRQFGDFTLDVTAEDGPVVAEVRKSGSKKRIIVKPGRSKKLVFKDMLPGRIYILYYSSAGSKVVRYSGKMVFKANDSPGNLARTAHDVGVLRSANWSKSQWVGKPDRVDYYKFKLASTDNISIRVIGLTGNVDVELLDAAEKRLGSSKFKGLESERIEYPNASPGTYYARVVWAGKLPAQYKLMVARGAVDTAGSSITDARDLKRVRNNKLDIRETVGGADRADFYKVNISKLSSLKFEVGGITSNVDLALYDRNGRVLYKSEKPGTQAEKIYLGLQPGQYYLAAFGKGSASTPYSMTVDVRDRERYSMVNFAYQMKVSKKPSEFSDRFTRASNHRWTKFHLPKKGRLRLDLSSPSPKSKLVMTVFHRSKKIATRVLDSTSLSFSQVLDKGSIHVNIKNRGAASPRFKLLARHTEEASKPRLTSRAAGTHRDWRVELVNSGSKLYSCIAYTEAQSVSPSGWRGKRPRLHFEVFPKGTVALHYFDKSNQYNTGRRINAAVNVRGQTRAIPVQLSSNKLYFKTLEKCSEDSKGWCVSNRGLQAITAGRTLTFSGITKDGRRSRITYSLSGYQNAIKRINSACNSKTPWLVQSGG